MGYPLQLSLAFLLFVSGVAKTQAAGPFFSVDSGATLNPFPYDGAFVLIDLDNAFVYAGRRYMQLYLNMNGFVSFSQPPVDFYPDPHVGRDGFAPLWVDIENDEGGNISYFQTTEGPLITQAAEALKMFADFNSTVNWVFVATWDNTPLELESANVTFQVVLITTYDGLSYVLMNYEDIPSLHKPWLAGFGVDNNDNVMKLPVRDSSALSSASNVGVPGRWVFSVQNGPNVNFIPIGHEAHENPFAYDGASVPVDLDSPFVYNRKSYSKLYLHMNGFVAFSKLPEEYYPDSNVGRDMIAPFWADIENDEGGAVFYEQAKNGSLIAVATFAINQAFPNEDFEEVTWVFVATWLRTPLEGDSGVVSFQLVLITDRDERSYVLMNYGEIPHLQQTWLAGFAEDNNYNFVSLPVGRQSSALLLSSNVELPGCWAFEVQNGPNVAALPDFFYSTKDARVLTDFSSDGNSLPLNLPGSFLYFGHFYNKLQINQNGYQSFLNPFRGNDPDPNANADIITPLRTSFNPGLIFYQQVTDGPFLAQATAEMKIFFPELDSSAGDSFSAAWLFITTWVDVPYSTKTGVTTFQTVLVGGEDDELSFLLMNYGHIDPTEQAWEAGYRSESGIYNYAIDEPSPINLSNSTNISIPGRWAFRVNGEMATCDTLQCTEDEVCVERTGIYGCGCAQNNPRSNPDTFDAIETCSGSSGTVSLSRCQLFEAGYSAQYLHLNEEKCRGVMEGDRVVFHFDNDEHNCSTVFTNNGTHFIYENNIRAIMGVGDQTVISRDRWLNIEIFCAYPLIQSISLPMAFKAGESVISKDLSTEGTYEIHMIPYRDPSFSTLYPTNDTLHVNDLLYVAVDVVGVNSTQISIVLDRCWATPVSDMNYNIYWNLINEECPNPEDGTVQVLQNGVSTSSRFSFKMFTFTSVSPYVFLHCKVHLCLVESSQCAQSCSGDRRMRRSLDFHDTASISMSF